MNANLELRRYLEILLAHKCMSGPDNCASCRGLQRVYQLVQTEIFSTVIYPTTATELRNRGEESGWARQAAASLRKPHAW